MKKFFRYRLLAFLFGAGLFCTNPVFSQTMGQFMGVNIHRTDPVERMTVASIVREYHFWEPDELDNTTYGFNRYLWNPADQNQALLNSWDVYYDKLQGAGLEVLVQTHRSIKALLANSACDDDKPVFPVGASTTDPVSYIWHADYLTQFASRYGAGGGTTLPPNFLKLAQGQSPNYHHGAVNYIENWNEQDKWWNLNNCPNQNFTPQEYAAMTKADLDGNGGAMLGWMNDPSNTYPLGLQGKGIPLVMGGLSEFDLGYLQALAAEFNGDLPFSYVNFHHYSDDDPDDPQDPGGDIGSVGICPEEDQLRLQLADLKVAVEAIAPGKPIWLTEFGYDSNPYSWRRSPEISGGPDGDYDNQEVQGQWIVRSFLEAIASGIERAFVFTLSDSNSKDNPAFPDPAGNGDRSSGLISDQGSGFQPKKSWYYTNTLRHVLMDYSFDQDLSEVPGNFCSGCNSPNTGDACDDLKPRVYRFTGGSNPILAIWSPSACANKLTKSTINGSDKPGVWIPVPSNTDKATIIEMKVGDPDGVRKIHNNFQTEGSQKFLVLNEVIERPIFVLLNEEIQDQPFPCPNLEFEMAISCDAVHVSWELASTTAYTGFRLYYVKKEDLPNPQDFDISQVSFFQEITNDPTNNTTSAVIGNLEAETEYWFFIEGLVTETDGSESVSIGVCHTEGTTLPCEDFCWIPLRHDWFSHTNFPTMNAFEYMFTSDYCPGTCGRANGPNATSNWTWDYTSPGNNTVDIVFPDCYSIDIIYLFDVNDIGMFDIQYQDANGTWHPLATYTTVRFQEWVYLTNFVPPGTMIKGLRFTMLDPMAIIGEILVCGERTNCFTGGGDDDKVRYPTIDGVVIIGSSPTGIDIQWDAVPAFFDQNSYIRDYLVRSGTQVDLNGYLINPDLTIVNTNGTTNPITATIPVQSGGDHTIHVGFAPCDRGCSGDDDEIFDAYIANGGNQNTAGSVLKDVLEMEIYPNPTKGFITVLIPEEDMVSAITVSDVHGKLLKMVGVQESSKILNIDLGILPTGVYFVAAVCREKIMTKKIVVLD